MQSETYHKILSLLHQEVKPALGCTEPVCVALCVAKAVSLLPGVGVESVSVKVSPNILKNAMGVGIPGTSLTGLPAAIALAVICGRPECGLEVLKDVDEAAVSKVEAFLPRISVGLADSPKLLYARAEVLFEGGRKAVCTVEDAHDNICYAQLDSEVLMDNRVEPSSGGEAALDGRFLNLPLIYEFASTADIADLELMRQEVEMNSALAREGLEGHCGLEVGRTIASSQHRDVYGSTLVTEAMAMTAAASDARMSGSGLPAMSNSGSGNQGLTVSLPVIAAARMLGSSEELLLRSLAVSNLVAIHIKSYLGKLSALCGCVVASTGSSCGIIMLKGGNTGHMAAAIKNMIGNISGMVCDGAKTGCALKVASGVSCALQSAVLALDGICIGATDGIIDDDVEHTIRNLGEIGSRAMNETDRMILEIMTSK